MSLRSRCQWNWDWNSAPLSVWTTWMRKGSRRTTSSMNRMAVAWLQASSILSTRTRVQSSIAVELIQARPGTRDAFQELHIDLQTVPWLGFLVALPALLVRPMLLVGRQAGHAVAHQNAMHRGHGQRHLVESLQVV